MARRESKLQASKQCWHGLTVLKQLWDFRRPQVRVWRKWVMGWDPGSESAQFHAAGNFRWSGLRPDSRIVNLYFRNNQTNGMTLARIEHNGVRLPDNRFTPRPAQGENKLTVVLRYGPQLYAGK